MARDYPVYDSIRQAAGALGCDAARLAEAKKLGCPAFRSNRVYTGELLSWLLSPAGSGFLVADQERLDLEQEQARVQREKRLKLEDERRVRNSELIPLQTLKDVVTPLGQRFRALVMDCPEKIGPAANPEHPDVAMAVLRVWRDDFFRAASELCDPEKYRLPNGAESPVDSDTETLE